MIKSGTAPPPMSWGCLLLLRRTARLLCAAAAALTAVVPAAHSTAPSACLSDGSELEVVVQQIARAHFPGSEPARLALSVPDDRGGSSYRLWVRIDGALHLISASRTGRDPSADRYCWKLDLAPVRSPEASALDYQKDAEEWWKRLPDRLARAGEIGVGGVMGLFVPDLGGLLAPAPPSASRPGDLERLHSGKALFLVLNGLCRVAVPEGALAEETRFRGWKTDSFRVFDNLPPASHAVEVAVLAALAEQQVRTAQASRVGFKSSTPRERRRKAYGGLLAVCVGAQIGGWTAYGLARSDASERTDLAALGQLTPRADRDLSRSLERNQLVTRTLLPVSAACIIATTALLLADRPPPDPVFDTGLGFSSSASPIMGRCLDPRHLGGDTTP